MFDVYHAHMLRVINPSFAYAIDLLNALPDDALKFESRDFDALDYAFSILYDGMVKMIEIKGAHNTAVCYTPKLEDAAERQIRAVCDRPEFAGCKIRIMPDVHAGKGCTIGTTMTIRDKIVPGMVGVDIGCGMETVELEERQIDFDKLDALIRREIPYGREVRGDPHPLNTHIDLTRLRWEGEP